MIDSLATEVCNGNVILFVGSGASNGLGLPTWPQLINHLGEDLGFDPDVFSSLSNALSLAEYYRLEKGSIGALRSWMDREWHVTDDLLRGSRIHELIVQLKFSLIYTTNYDPLLERAFELQGKPFNRIINARDIARADSRLTTIVKFHGDFEDDSSLVISESDYFNRLAFDGPLDIKLRADAIGKTLLFIGYSLSDLNIRLMLFQMKNLWRQSGFEDSRPRSYVLMSRPNVVQERILRTWDVHPLMSDGADETKGLCQFLESLLVAVRALRPEY